MSETNQEKIARLRREWEEARTLAYQPVYESLLSDYTDNALSEYGRLYNYTVPPESGYIRTLYGSTPELNPNETAQILGYYFGGEMPDDLAYEQAVYRTRMDPIGSGFGQYQYSGSNDAEFLGDVYLFGNNDDSLSRSMHETFQLIMHEGRNPLDPAGRQIFADDNEFAIHLSDSLATGLGESDTRKQYVDWYNATQKPALDTALPYNYYMNYDTEGWLRGSEEEGWTSPENVSQSQKTRLRNINNYYDLIDERADVTNLTEFLTDEKAKEYKDAYIDSFTDFWSNPLMKGSYDSDPEAGWDPDRVADLLIEHTFMNSYNNTGGEHLSSPVTQEVTELYNRAQDDTLTENERDNLNRDIFRLVAANYYDFDDPFDLYDNVETEQGTIRGVTDIDLLGYSQYDTPYFYQHQQDYLTNKPTYDIDNYIFDNALLNNADDYVNFYKGDDDAAEDAFYNTRYEIAKNELINSFTSGRYENPLPDQQADPEGYARQLDYALTTLDREDLLDENFDLASWAETYSDTNLMQVFTPEELDPNTIPPGTPWYYRGNYLKQTGPRVTEGGVFVGMRLDPFDPDSDATVSFYDPYSDQIYYDERDGFWTDNLGNVVADYSDTPYAAGDPELLLLSLHGSHSLFSDNPMSDRPDLGPGQLEGIIRGAEPEGWSTDYASSPVATHPDTGVEYRFNVFSGYWIPTGNFNPVTPPEQQPEQPTTPPVTPVSPEQTIYDNLLNQLSTFELYKNDAYTQWSIATNAYNTEIQQNPNSPSAAGLQATAQQRWSDYLNANRQYLDKETEAQNYYDANSGVITLPSSPAETPQEGRPIIDFGTPTFTPIGTPVVSPINETPRDEINEYNPYVERIKTNIRDKFVTDAFKDYTTGRITAQDPTGYGNALDFGDIARFERSLAGKTGLFGPDTGYRHGFYETLNPDVKVDPQSVDFFAPQELGGGQITNLYNDVRTDTYLDQYGNPSDPRRASSPNVRTFGQIDPATNNLVTGYDALFIDNPATGYGQNNPIPYYFVDEFDPIQSPESPYLKDARRANYGENPVNNNDWLLQSFYDDYTDSESLFDSDTNFIKFSGMSQPFQTFFGDIANQRAGVSSLRPNLGALSRPNLEALGRPQLDIMLREDLLV